MIWVIAGDEGEDEEALYCEAVNKCTLFDKYKKIGKTHNCGLTDRCINPNQLCDGRVDCVSRSDEDPSRCGNSYENSVFGPGSGEDYGMGMRMLFSPSSSKKSRDRNRPVPVPEEIPNQTPSEDAMTRNIMELEKKMEMKPKPKILCPLLQVSEVFL